MNEFIVENLKNKNKNKKKLSKTNVQIELNNLKKNIYRNTKNIAHTAAVPGDRGPRGLRGQTGPKGDTGGTHIFKNRPLYFNNKGGEYILSKTNLVGSGAVNNLMLVKKNPNIIGPNTNWTLTSDKKLKSMDGSCVYVDQNNSKNKLQINQNACNKSNWIYNHRSQLQSGNYILTIDNDKNKEKQYQAIIKNVNDIRNESTKSRWNTWI